MESKKEGKNGSTLRRAKWWSPT